MAIAVIPTPEQWAVLEDLGITSSTNVVIVAPAVAYKCNLDNDMIKREADEFDGSADPDCWVEIVTDMEHAFIDHLVERGKIK